MAKYRKRPVVIEALQFDGSAETAEGILAWATERDPRLGGPMRFADWGQGPSLEIRTREGVMRADPGDWIICGVQGEFYPIKDSIFRETYEPVEAN